MTFDATKPTISTDLNQSNIDLLANLVALQKGEHFTSASEPSYKQEGTPWWDSANDLFKIYDGSNWQTIAAKISSILDYGSSASASTARTQNNLKIAYGYVTVNQSSSQAITNLPFTSSTSYIVIVTGNTTSTDFDTGPGVVRNSGAQFTLYNTDGNAGNIVLSWFAIGI